MLMRTTALFLVAFFGPARSSTAVQEAECPQYSVNLKVLGWDQDGTNDQSVVETIDGNWKFATNATTETTRKLTITTPAGVEVVLKRKDSTTVTPGAHTCIWIEDDFAARQWVKLGAPAGAQANLFRYAGGVLMVADVHPTAATDPAWGFVQIDVTGTPSIDSAPGQTVARGCPRLR